MKKKRTHNIGRIKKSRSYRYFEIAELFNVHPNVIPRWVQAGLKRIDDQKPFMVHGRSLAEFLSQRQATRKNPCKRDEIWCCKCRRSTKPWEGAIDIEIRNTKTVLLSGLCAACDTHVMRIGSLSKIPEYQKIFKIQTINRTDIIGDDEASVKCDLETGEQS